MAIQTPLHMQGLCLPREWHFVDAAVTGFTANSLMDVNAVIEVDEVRKIVDAHPFQRTVVTQACANGFQRWAIGPNLLVTVHAYFGRRNACK